MGFDEAEDGGPAVPDAGMDAALDGARDSSRDTAVDSPLDSSIPVDARPDASSDAAVDAGSGLVDRGALVRYFLDEGTTTGPVRSSQSPLDLLFIPASPSITPVSLSTGAGFDYPTLGSDDRICAPIAGTAVETLEGGTTGTIEVVADMVEGHTSSSRLAAIGQLATDNWGFSVGFRTISRRLIFSMNGTTMLFGDWSGMPTGRHVFTVVVDSTQALATDRLQLYIDGAPGPANDGIGLTPSQAIALGADAHLCIGNRANAGRGLLGQIYYAAYYSSALSAMEVGANAARLLVNDD